MTPEQRIEYDRLCKEQGKCFKRIGDIESRKLAMLSPRPKDTGKSDDSRLQFISADPYRMLKELRGECRGRAKRYPETSGERSVYLLIAKWITQFLVDE